MSFEQALRNSFLCANRTTQHEYLIYTHPKQSFLYPSPFKKLDNKKNLQKKTQLRGSHVSQSSHSPTSNIPLWEQYKREVLVEGRYPTWVRCPCILRLWFTPQAISTDNQRTSKGLNSTYVPFSLSSSAFWEFTSQEKQLTLDLSNSNIQIFSVKPRPKWFITYIESAEVSFIMMDVIHLSDTISAFRFHGYRVGPETTIYITRWWSIVYSLG